MTSSVDTLAAALRDASVDAATLRRRYGPNLAIVRAVLGEVPNHFAYLEIWPTGMRTCNLLIPNFLNLPFLLYGAGPPKETVGLVMYAASRAAGCGYCTAHCCSFAISRGAAEKDVVSASEAPPLDGAAADAGAGQDPRTAALDVADGMSRVPGGVTPRRRDALRAAYSRADAEWVVLAAAMMGFLNKFMDTMGMPLEPGMFATAERVIGPTGWRAGRHLPRESVTSPGAPPPRDTFGAKVGMVPLMPALIYRDKRWTSGVPHAWPAVGEYLRARTGHDFPILRHLGHARARRALATMVRDNAEASHSALGPLAKHLAGLVFASALRDEALAAAMRALAARHGATPRQLDGGLDGLDARARAALALADAASGSPVQITPDVIDRTTSELTPPMIIELCVWLGVLQLLHRLHAFYLD
jgi:alkylhydroperoxidase family enzyme